MTIRPYTAYKRTNLAWLPQVPEHWELAKNKFLFDEINQRTETGIEELLSLSKYFGLVPRSSLDSEKGALANTLVGYKICSQGDLVLNKLQAWNGTLDISKFYGLVSPDYSVYRSKGSINIKFFYYLFKTGYYIGEFAKNSYGVGEGFFRLYSTEFFNIHSIHPPLAEQTAIAEFLDRKTTKIDTAIAKKQQLIELLKEQKQAMILRFFDKNSEDVKLIKLKYLSKIVRGASPRPAGDPKYFANEGVSWITVGSVTNNTSKYLDNTQEFLTEEGKNQSRYINEGTLLFSNSGATLGVPIISKISGCINDGVVAFLDLKKRQIDITYLYYFLTSLTSKLRVELNIGATQPNLNTDKIKGIKIPLPSLTKQAAIVAHIERESQQTDTTISRIEREIELLKEYRTTLIANAVTGRIKVI